MVKIIFDFGNLSDFALSLYKIFPIVLGIICIGVARLNPREYTPYSPSVIIIPDIELIIYVLATPKIEPIYILNPLCFQINPISAFNLPN